MNPPADDSLGIEQTARYGTAARPPQIVLAA